MVNWPLDVPPEKRVLPDAPGQFGAERTHDVHTGVDLYCEAGTRIVSLRDGLVVGVERFTGEWCEGRDHSPWWNNTAAVVVLSDDGSGVIIYGEADPKHPLPQVGTRVKEGDVIGVVDTPVVKTRNGRPTRMLHLEWYSAMPEEDSVVSVWWCPGDIQPDRLLNPLPLLDTNVPVFDLSKYDGLAFTDPEAPRKESHWWAVWGG